MRRHCSLLLTGLLLAVGTADGQQAGEQQALPVLNSPAAIPGIVVVGPSAGDFYPEQSILLGEQGEPGIRVCYDGNGKIVESTVLKSSGSRRLDRAAVMYGRKFRIQPAEKGGAIAAGCFATSVKFTLKNFKF